MPGDLAQTRWLHSTRFFVGIEVRDVEPDPASDLVEGDCSFRDKATAVTGGRPRVLTVSVCQGD